MSTSKRTPGVQPVNLRGEGEKYRAVVENVRKGILGMSVGKRAYDNSRWLGIIEYSTEEYKTRYCWKRG